MAKGRWRDLVAPELIAQVFWLTVADVIGGNGF